MMAMSYGNVFVGQIAMGANPVHAIKTILAAESFRGASLILAFSHCIGWGIDMTTGMNYQKEAVACGYWPLFTFDPRNEDRPFSLDSKQPKGDFKEFALKAHRFGMLARSKPDESERLLQLGQGDIDERWHYYQQLAAVEHGAGEASEEAAAASGNGGGNGEGKAKAEKEATK